MPVVQALSSKAKGKGTWEFPITDAFAVDTAREIHGGSPTEAQVNTVKKNLSTVRSVMLCFTRIQERSDIFVAAATHYGQVVLTLEESVTKLGQAIKRCDHSVATLRDKADEAVSKVETKKKLAESLVNRKAPSGKIRDAWAAAVKAEEHEAKCRREWEDESAHREVMQSDYNKAVDTLGAARIHFQRLINAIEFNNTSGQ